MSEFEIRDAVRVAQAVSIGLVGPSGCGKTLSALRLASGMQSVIGGDIHVIDTEARRALDYADQFRFKHIDFAPPFGADRYLAAIEMCVAAGAKIVIVDSLSHEHESEGGMLEQFERELERLGGGEKNNFRAWIKPKAMRRKLVVRMEQMRGVNFILTFRAADQTKPPKKGEREVQHLGFMPIGGREFVYSTKATALLLAGADGVPTWNPENMGEKLMRKLPNYLKAILDDGKALSEDHGRKIAEWAKGSGAAPPRKPVEGASLAERAARAVETINAKNTIAGVESAFAKCAELLKECAAAEDIEIAVRITAAKDRRLEELRSAT